MINLTGQKALVTGGTRGIGREIAFTLARAGCKVVFTYFSSDEIARAIESEAAAEGLTMYGCKADAGSFVEAEKSVNFTLEKLGGLDILVNNAGVTKDGLLLRMAEADFDSVITANLKSVFNYTKCAVKVMMSQRSGRIINIASVVGIIGNPGQSNYVASKAGVIGFTKSVAKEVATRNVTVNAIAPGFIETEMTGKLNEKQKEAIMNMIPMKKFGGGAEIAGTVAFLCSPLAGYITGQVISVDGGMAM